MAVPRRADGRLYLGGQSGAPMSCVTAKDGSLKWKVDNVSYSHHPALGEDYLSCAATGATGIVRDLATGKPVIRDKREVLGGCPDHSCAPVLLTSGRFSYAVSSSGLYAPTSTPEKSSGRASASPHALARRPSPPTADFSTAPT